MPKQASKQTGLVWFGLTISKENTHARTLLHTKTEREREREILRRTVFMMPKLYLSSKSSMRKGDFCNKGEKLWQ